MNPRIYLTSDPAKILAKESYVAPPPAAGTPDDLRDASLRLRVLGAARMGSVWQAEMVARADAQVLPHVPARRRRSFRRALLALLAREGDKEAPARVLLGCPCIGSLSETLLRVASEATSRLGFRCTITCGEGDGPENQAVLRLILHTTRYEDFIVEAVMREETFMATSIQNWSHLQAVVKRI